MGVILAIDINDSCPSIFIIWIVDLNIATHFFLYVYCLSFCAPMQRVSEGALSPDGTVLATASHDGYIKFWQIYIEGGQDKPRSASMFWIIAFWELQLVVCFCSFVLLNIKDPLLDITWSCIHLHLGVCMNCGLTEDAHFPVFFSVTTTRGRIQSQYLQLHHITTEILAFAVHIFLTVISLYKGPILEIFDHRRWSEPGVENVVHRFLDLFTDHQVIALSQCTSCCINTSTVLAYCKFMSSVFFFLQWIKL